jgi:hypothetical protein
MPEHTCIQDRAEQHTATDQQEHEAARIVSLTGDLLQAERSPATGGPQPECREGMRW